MLKAATKKKRAVFISASYLVDEWHLVPKAIIYDSIFFFGSDRRWIFPTTPEEIAEAKKQPTKYLKFPEDFKNLILEKEKQGLVYFLKPEKNYDKVSDFFCKVIDPTTGKNYPPLKLNEEWWLTEFKAPRYIASAKRVISNFKAGEHDYNGTMELLAQSMNVTPVLTYNPNLSL